MMGTAVTKAFVYGIVVLCCTCGFAREPDIGLYRFIERQLINNAPYAKSVWIDTRTGQKTHAESIPVQTKEPPVSFAPPSRDTDWELIFRTASQAP